MPFFHADMLTYGMKSISCSRFGHGGPLKQLASISFLHELEEVNGATPLPHAFFIVDQMHANSSILSSERSQ